jgi:uncharacterized membrane protein
MSIVHLHLLLSHVPVVGIVFALVIFGASLLFREGVSIKFALWVSAALAVVAVVVYFTGGAAEEAVEKLAGVTGSAIDKHEEAAEVTTVAMSVFGALCLAVLGFFRRRPVPRWVAVSGLVGTVALGALTGWTANLGGQIRHTEIRSANLQQSDHEPDD